MVDFLNYRNGLVDLEQLGSVVAQLLPLCKKFPDAGVVIVQTVKDDNCDTPNDNVTFDHF